MADPLFLGVNSAYHESAAVIVRGREVCFALEEERLTRVKHGKPARVDNAAELPWGAIDACLEAVGATLDDLDGVAYSLVPGLRQRTIGVDDYPLTDPEGFGSEAGEARFDAEVRSVRRLLAERAADGESFAEQVKLLSHHRCHAAGAFYGGPFHSAAALVIDGIGEHETAWLGVGRGDKLERIEGIVYPHSIGMLWEQLARYVGFSEYDAGKAMGLAAYGDATRFGHVIDKLFLVPDPEGGEPGSSAPPFIIDGALARFRGDLSGWESLFGPARAPDEELIMDGRHADVAAAVQVATEEALLATATRLYRALERRGEAQAARNLVYAGGVALNCVANARLERHGPFEAIYIPGPANDAGTALGAALDLAARAGFARARPAAPLPAALGPGYDAAAIDA
ncbi:MAG: hypothetical protein KC503_38925, partial [Myxococcales bacterium]|nr:hypothetical protein [Myxococcales bacterium]